MALTEEQADGVVQTSIPEAGGRKGPHHGNRTLNGAGLKLPDQRRQFRHRVVANTLELGHDISLGQIPNGAGTRVAQARQAIKEKATPRA